jgi:hypothetical protein
MADYPPLNKFYTASYSANDRDFPVVAIRLDPRTAGYRVPEDLSPHPDSKRYPNHVFTGAQPASGDQVVTHIYEILPAPYVPFTRYDDDLGPIQGRRRSVKNEGQVARLGPDQRVNYEAREGSAIVYTEIEESWSVATDDDGNSLFPIRDRDFYDASRGAVQERRQLFVPTGEEEGTLENINGVITQTSYEPYNEYLSIKIIQTYRVDGPQLIGKVTDEARQLATVTTQRKGAADYVPPNPTATRTVEVSREDAESLIERIVEVPNVFEGKSLSLEKPDVTPEKFRAAVPASSVETSVAGTVTDPITLAGNEISKSEQQVTEFVKRIRAITRDPAAEGTLTGEVFTGELGGGTATVTERYGATVNISPAYGTVAAEKEALGDGKFVTREVELASPPELTGQNYDEELDIVFPFTQQFVEPNTGVGDERTEIQPRDVFHSLKRNVDIDEFRNAALDQYWSIGDFVNVSLPDKLTAVDIIKTVAISSGQAKGAGSTGWDSSANSSCTITYSVRPNIINGYSGTVTATRYVFFLDRESSTIDQIKNKIESINSDNTTLSAYLNSLFSSNALSVSYWPNIKPEPVTITLNGGSITRRVSKGLNVISIGGAESAGSGNANGSDNFDTNLQASVVNVPATLHGSIVFNKVFGVGSPTTNEWYTYKLERNGNAELPDGLSGLEAAAETISAAISIDSDEINYYPSSVAQTGSYSSFPIGNYIVSVDSQSYKYGLVRVTAVVAHITSGYV